MCRIPLTPPNLLGKNKTKQPFREQPISSYGYEYYQLCEVIIFKA